MNKRLFHFGVSLLLTAFLLNACAGGAPEQTQPLRVGWSLWANYYPIVIAEKQGLFEKHGVAVELVFYENYTHQPSDLASKMLDGAALGVTDILYDAISEDVKAVLVLGNSAGAEEIVAAPSVKSPQDLRGKRIGYAPSIVSSALLIRQMLKENNVPFSEVQLVVVAPDKVPDAIPKLADAAYTYDPYTSAALAKGNRVIFSTANTPGLGADVLAFRKEIVRERPEDVRAFVAAWLEAVDFWKKNPEEGNALIAEATGLSPAEVAPIGVDLFNRNANRLTFIPGSTYVSIYYTAEQSLNYLINSGSVTKPVNLQDLFDPSFIQ